MGAGLIEVTLELLEEALGVPDDVRITGVEAYDSIRRVVRMRVDGLGLPGCAEGCTPVIVNLQSPGDGEDEVVEIALREGVECLGSCLLPSRV